ncbi:MAG TPA: CPBP family intramembrane glutamic endopeptidase [Polyangiaceae bacterium]|nr:CPBP family intramembrane glutamic endopeptidase [Polyangiaceae bacterium]
MNTTPSDARALGLLISALLSAVLQVLVLSAIPVLVHRIWFRRRLPLLQFLGLYAPEGKSVLAGLGVAAGALGIFAALNAWFQSDLLNGAGAVAKRFEHAQPPAAAYACMLLSAFVQTALAEEIFFRGFLAKRLIARCGPGLGNALQALIFGSLHVLLVLKVASGVPLWQALVFGVLVSLGGAGLGYVDEVRGNGSIVPAWLAHGTLNLVTYLWVRWF